MINKFKQLITSFSPRYRVLIKSSRYNRQIKKGSFVTDEPEFEKLSEWIEEGDWVLDLGANIGHYTLKFAELVGATGRVLSFEPSSETFRILAMNTSNNTSCNISLFNCAVSDSTSISGMSVPLFEDGSPNLYMNAITEDNTGEPVFCIKVDDIDFCRPIKFIKLDVEAHELKALKGMERLLQKDHPILIVEDYFETPDIIAYLEQFGYKPQRLDKSPNTIFKVS